MTINFRTNSRAGLLPVGADNLMTEGIVQTCLVTGYIELFVIQTGFTVPVIFPEDPEMNNCCLRISDGSTK